MRCDKFKCVYDVDGECEAEGGECIGDMCECFGECNSCQDRDREECDGLKQYIINYLGGVYHT